MRERPILFSGPMVRAILDGRKTMTRRLVKPQPTGAHCVRMTRTSHGWFGAVFFAGGSPESPGIADVRSPYGVPGDRLWVREMWAHYHTVNSVRRTDGRTFSEVSDGLAGYRADGHDTIEDFREHIRLMSECDLEHVVVNGDRWRPSIHMPRWASRITLEITDVRVERLWETTQADARAEGITDGGCLSCGMPEPCGCPNAQPDAVDAFIHLWDQINSKRAPWASNPWVWVVSFERITPPGASSAEGEG